MYVARYNAAHKTDTLQFTPNPIFSSSQKPVTLQYMLSFRNAKTVDLYINRKVSENWAFIRKSKGLGKSGFYA